MPTFIIMMNWTEQGIRNVKDAHKRAAAAKEMAKKAGVEIKQTYLTNGQFDLVSIVESASGDNIAKFCMQVGALGELEEDRQALLALQVQRHCLLVAVQVLEIGAVAPAAGGVGVLARHLDLDDVGAPIGELAHRGRAGAVGGQVDDREAVERQGRRGHQSVSPLENDAVMLAPDQPGRHRRDSIAGP